MSALSHYIEAQGVATTGISLVREHSEAMKPPRALWVPFELGRPLGAPGDRAFQLDVVRAALALTAEPAGPVLADYPRDAPGQGNDEDAAWSCVLPLPPVIPSSDPVKRRRQALRAELSALLPWYGESVRARGRTTFGASGLPADAAPSMMDMLAEASEGVAPVIPAGILGAMPAVLRPVADDLKSLYLEAAAAQPGASAPGANRLNTWLYHETRLGQALYDIRDRLAAEAAALPEGAPRVAPPALIPNRYRARPAHPS